MNLLNFKHSIPSLFILSLRIYQKNILAILFLTAALIAPAFVMSIAGWGETESIVFFLSVHVLEGAITLGVIGTAFGSFFPALGILRALRSPLFLMAVHVAILQYLLFITGVMGLTLPFPFSILVVSLWLGGLLLTSMAQPICIVEGVRGMRAMARSIQLARGDLSRVFIVVVISTILQFIVFALLFTIFMPELNLNIEPNSNEEITSYLAEILSDPGIHQAIRWSQYLASLLFYPFASLLTTLLYFDLANRQQVLNVDNLAHFSNQLFGTPLAENETDSSSAAEDVVEPKDVEIIEPESSDEDKAK
ncbi:MAG: hypothetical protein H8E38_13575 [SAR324 cluster bacterium]|nr:hypothetical protein [SAR324 cluster bacterium]MBL7036120.1 hypothetical protein [SAR324 cluster bacterium]